MNAQGIWELVKSSGKFVLLSELVEQCPDLKDVVLTETPSSLKSELEWALNSMEETPMLALIGLAPKRGLKKRFSKEFSDRIREMLFEKCLKEACSARELYDILV